MFAGKLTISNRIRLTDGRVSRPLRLTQWRVQGMRVRPTTCLILKSVKLSNRKISADWFLHDDLYMYAYVYVYVYRWMYHMHIHMYWTYCITWIINAYIILLCKPRLSHYLFTAFSCDATLNLNNNSNSCLCFNHNNNHNSC